MFNSVSFLNVMLTTNKQTNKKKQLNPYKKYFNQTDTKKLQGTENSFAIEGHCTSAQGTMCWPY